MNYSFFVDSEDPCGIRGSSLLLAAVVEIRPAVCLYLSTSFLFVRHVTTCTSMLSVWLYFWRGLPAALSVNGKRRSRSNLVSAGGWISQTVSHHQIVDSGEQHVSLPDSETYKPSSLDVRVTTKKRREIRVRARRTGNRAAREQHDQLP